MNSLKVSTKHDNDKRKYFKIKKILLILTIFILFLFIDYSIKLIKRILVKIRQKN